jgi:hypothetical protein
MRKISLLRFNKIKLCLLLVNFVVLVSAGLFVSAGKAEAGISNSPEYVRILLDDGSGNAITNATVTLKLGPIIPGYFCGYAGNASTNWSGTHVGGGEYHFNNGGELQICCDLQTFLVDVSASGFQTRTNIDVTDYILGNNGFTTVIPISLSPNQVTPSPIGVIWNCNSTSSVSAAIAWTHDSRQTNLWIDEGNNGTIDRNIAITSTQTSWSLPSTDPKFAPNTDVKFAIVGSGLVFNVAISRTPACGSTTLGARPSITPCEHNCWPDASLSWNKNAMWFVTWCLAGTSTRGSNPGENASNGGFGCNNTSNTFSTTDYSRSFATGVTYYWWVDILLINSSGNPQWYAFQNGNLPVSCSGTPPAATCSKTINWSNPTQTYQAVYTGTLYNACDGVPTAEGCTDTGTTTTYPNPTVTLTNVAPNQHYDAYVWINGHLFNTVADAGSSGSCTCTLKPPITTNPGSLRVSVFNDISGDGIQQTGEEDVQITSAPTTQVRRGSTAGPALPLISGAYLRYGASLNDGNYQVFLFPDPAITITKYSYTAPGGAAYTGNVLYGSSGGGWSNTIAINVDDDKTTKVKLGVKFNNTPDLTITTNYPQVIGSPLTTTTLFTLTGKVHNSSLITVNSAFNSRFCLDTSSCYTSLTDQIGTDQTWSTSLAGGSDTGLISITTTIAAGAHTVYFCADTPRPGAISESNEDNNCSPSLPFTILSPASLPWVQTTKGNVGSLGDNNLTTPCGGNPCSTPINLLFAEKLVISEQNIAEAGNAIVKTAKDWLIEGYPPSLLPTGPNAPTNYNDFQKLYSASTACSIGNTSIPNAKGKFIVTGTLALNGAVISNPCAVPAGKDSALVFVNGGINITAQPLNFARPTVFIATGDITVASNVQTITNAIFITDGSFHSGTKYTGAIVDDTLTINGSVVAALGLAGTPKLYLERNRGAVNNPTTPSEVINFNPSYLYYLIEYAGVTPTYYKEENP